MIHEGENLVNGIKVSVERKPIRRINIRIRPDGVVHLSIPSRWSTLHEGEAFLLSKWDWVVDARAKQMARQPAVELPISQEEKDNLIKLLSELLLKWAVQVNESGIKWKIRDLKSVWGTCHIRKRILTFNLKLARATREQVEYVVVHEITHLKVADHGPDFKKLMTERLPGWPQLRRALNGKNDA